MIWRVDLTQTMNQDLVISTRLVDRPDGEQPGPWQFPIDVEWKNLEAMVGVIAFETIL